MKRTCLCALLLLLSFASARAFAEEDALSVKAEVNKAFLTVGERVEYRVTIGHDPSVQILSKIVPPPSDAFEVKEVHDFSEKQGKQIVEGRRFILTTYELGEFLLEPVTLQYRTAAGVEKSIRTNQIFLTVESVDPGGKPKTDIRGPKPVLELPRRGLRGLALAFLAAGVGFLIWRRLRRGPLSQHAAQEPELSPEDEALLRLSQLFDSDLLGQGRLKEYYLKLSEILRHYFERRFEILAVESTTSEIIRDLRGKEVPQSLLSRIQQVLDFADLVKFAKLKPSPQEIARINQAAKAVVEEARPPALVPAAAPQ